MKVLNRLALIVSLAILSISGCHLIYPFEIDPAPAPPPPPKSNFHGKFKGPLTYAKGPYYWGETMEITLNQQDKQSNGTWAFHGDARTFLKDGTPQVNFKVIGQVDTGDQTKAQLSFVEVGRSTIINVFATIDLSKGELDIAIAGPPPGPGPWVKGKLTKL